MPAWRGAAFGLELRGDFPAPGIAGTPGGDGARSADLVLRDEAELTREWLPAEEQVLSVQELPRGAFVISGHPEDGYRMRHPHYGVFRVSADGRQVVNAPNHMADWHWQRFLVGQTLPLAATLQGLEPLHASVVAVGDRAALVMGTSGAGKTSVALHAASGAGRFVADDVASLELRDDTVVVHPGPPLASLDPEGLGRLPGGLVETLGEADGEIRVLVSDPERRALPVAAVYVVTRRNEGELSVAEPRVGLPEVLLGGTFNAYLRDPDRLVRQLELSARLAALAPVRQITVPPEADAAAVAATLLDDLG